MPKRRTTIKVACDEVQGEDSWVELRQLTYKEFREKLYLSARAQEAMRDRTKGKESDDSGLSGEDLVNLIKANFDHVLAWNWVDNDGEPLPQPQESPDAIELLNNGEIQFLGRVLMEGRSDLKN